ncbi:MAG: nickel pincer cofactor biosynthesis protein LarC [Candidatus Heimdallarchaeota archaeon]|nr:nickel pincer cofactor biosynthesis protein LarC [Candidatus Heimdallarchaeota archaeon]
MIKDRILAIDVNLAGCAGDMLISGLLGQIDSPSSYLSKLSGIFTAVLGAPLTITVSEKDYNDIKGLHLRIENEIQLDYNRILELIPLCCHNLGMSESYKALCIKTFQLLLQAERDVHGKEEIHLHELGTSDTLVDIVVSLYLIEKLEISAIQISSVATGTGTINTSHGKLIIPTPVTQKLFEVSGLETCVGPKNGEATTPTGAVILSILKAEFQKPKHVIWQKNSIGFGTRSWSDRGNYLRVRLGYRVKTHSQISVLETNVDDVNAEILGHAIGQLMGDGALDVSYYPIIMKKNRPAYAIKVICKKEDEMRIADQIMRLTGTLGIRINSVDRHIGSREYKKINVTIQDREFSVKLKIGKYRTKIEFDDIVHIATELDLSPLDVQKIIEGMINDRK